MSKKPADIRRYTVEMRVFLTVVADSPETVENTLKQLEFVATYDDQTVALCSAAKLSITPEILN